MVALTIAETIAGLSFYTVGATGDMTAAELTTLQALVAGDLSRLDPGFIGDEKTKFEAYLVLDLFENKPGTGARTTEKIKDNSYTVKAPSSSSFWMDKANQMIIDFRAYYTLTNSEDNGNEYDGVTRSDSQMPEFSDGYLQPEYGSPDDLGNSDSGMG